MLKNKAFSCAYRATALATALQLAFGSTAWALPQGGVVTQGQAAISSTGTGQMQVQAGNGAIIQWQSFSIGAGEITRFVQPSATSSVLNRVVGGNMSELLGQLQSNGRVFLINPSGILIGAGARIDANSFIASTLDMADADFLAGKLRFLGGAGAGGIRNNGVITAGPGGRVALIAPDIENSGIIQAPGGQILLAAGRKLEIASLDFEGVTFEIQAPTDAVLNLGKLLADNGAVQAFAGTLRHSGEIRANRLVQDGDGSIRLSGSNEVTLTSDSVTRADGLAGGAITLQSKSGTTRVAGLVSAVGSDGAGGDIRLLGERVAVEAATVDASGRTGGGQVLVGGDFQGKNADVQNAQRVFVGAAAQIKADALESGDGGRVIVWADENTRYAGHLSAMGGVLGGNGGFAEVSGKANLEFTGSANLAAPAGQFGSLLLDPLDIVITGTGGLLSSVVDQFADFAANVVTISPTTLAAVGANVTLQAARDIYFNAPVALTTAGAGLTAVAGGVLFNAGQIYLDNSVSTHGGAITLRSSILTGTGGITTLGGAVDVKTYYTSFYSGEGDTYSGLINSAGGAVTLASQTGAVYAANVNAGAGAIQVTGSFVNGGTYTTTGAAALNATAGYISGTSVTAGTANLTATSSVNASVNASDRVNATSAGSSITLYNLAGQPLNLGTLNAASSMSLNSNAGFAQAAGGTLTSPYVQINSQSSTTSTGSSAAPLVIASPRLVVSAMAAPAFVSFSGSPILTQLQIDGTIAALGGSSFSGAGNLTSLAMSAGSGELNLAATSGSGLGNGFSVTASNGGINASTLTMPGAVVTLNAHGALTVGAMSGDSLYGTATGAVALGTINTTGSSGIYVTTGACGSGYGVTTCATNAPITATSLTAGGSGDITLRTYDNGGINVGTLTAGDSIAMYAGGTYSNYYYPYQGFVATGNLAVGTASAGGSFTARNLGSGNLTISNPLTAGYGVDLRAGASYDADGYGANPSALVPSVITTAGIQAGSTITVANQGVGGVTLAGVSATTSGNVSVSAVNDVHFGSVATTAGSVSISSSQGHVKTTGTGSGTDVTASGNVTITASNTSNGYIGNVSNTDSLDIVAGAASGVVTLTAGKDIGASGGAVTVDNTGTVAVSTSNGQFYVAAQDAKTVRLSATAAGIGNGGASTYTSTNLTPINATSDGSVITIGSVQQSAGTLNEFRFSAAGSGLTLGDVALATTGGYNQLFLVASGPLTQASGNISGGNIDLASGSGAMQLGNVTSAVAVENGIHLVGGVITAGNLNGPDINVSGSSLSLGTVTSTGTHRGYPQSSYTYVPRLNTNLYPVDELRLSASSGSITAGTIASATSAFVSASNGISVGGGSGTMDGGHYVSSYYVDTLSVSAGTGTLAAGNLSAHDITATGAALSLGAATITADRYMTVSGTTLNTGNLTSGSNMGVSGTTFNTGDLSAGTGLLTVNATGAYTPVSKALSGGSVTINAGGNIDLVTGSSTLTAPTVSLNTVGGDITANLANATNLTLSTDQKFNVATAATLTVLNVTAQGDLAGAGGGSSVTGNGGNQAMSLLFGSNLALGVKSTTSLASTYHETAALASVPLISLSNTGTYATGSIYVDAGQAAITVPSLITGGASLTLSADGPVVLTSVNTGGGTVNVSSYNNAVDLTSVTSGGGSVTAYAGGASADVNVKSVVTTGGNVSLTSESGSIVKAAGASAVQIEANDGNGGNAGLVTLSASEGSIGAGGAIGVGHFSGADITALNAVDVNVVNTLVDLTSLSITTNASGSGTIAIGSANFGNLVLTRTGTTDLNLSGVTPVTAPGAFSLTARDGNINVLGSISNVTNLTLDAGYNQSSGNLVLQTNGVAKSVTATGTLNLKAGNDVIIAGDTDKAVTVQGANTYIYANQDVQVLAGTLSGSNAQLIGTYTYVNAGRDIKVVADGGAAVLNQSTNSSQQYLYAGRDVRVVGGSGAANASAGIVSAGSQSVQASNDLLIQGGSALGASAALQATGSQYIYSNNLSVLGGGDSAYASIQGASQDMTNIRGNVVVGGGAGVGAYAEMVAASGSQTIGTQYTYYYNPTDSVLVQGGSGSGAYASIKSAGTQYVYSGVSAGTGNISVLAGSGAGANAEIWSQSGSQTIGTTNSYYYYVPTGAVLVQASGTGTARIQAAGTQYVMAGGNISVLGGSGSGMTASIETTGGSQTIGSAANNYNNSDQTDNILVQGGTAANAQAFIRALNGQTLEAGQNITVTGGSASGASALIESTSGTQRLGYLYNSYNYDQTNVIALQAGTGTNAFAKVNSGGTQALYSTSGITLSGGAGDGSGAMLLATSGQTLQTTGALTMTGGSGSAPGLNETAIRNSSTGTQSISATTGITVSGGGYGSDTWIKQLGTGAQSISATNGALTLQALTASTGVTSIESGTGQQTINVGDVITVNNQAGWNTYITAGGNQTITADAMTISMASTSGSAPVTGVLATGNQTVSLVGGASPASLTITNASTAAGAVSKLDAGGNQVISLYGAKYSNAGMLKIGDVAGQGTALVHAGGNQTIIAGELLIQGGATTAADASLLATGNILISTLNGPVQVLGGTQGAAEIDPPNLDVVSNGSIVIASGAGSTASASVVAGNINMTATNGNMLVVGGGAPASVTANSFNLATSGNLTFTPGTTGASIAATLGGNLDLGGSCNVCSTSTLVGPFNLQTGLLPVAAADTPLDGLNPNLLGYDFLSLLDVYADLFVSEDGSLIVDGRRRSLNQCY